MAGITRFEEIDAWVTSRQLTNMIYSLSNQTAFSRDFGLGDQSTGQCFGNEQHC